MSKARIIDQAVIFYSDMDIKLPQKGLIPVGEVLDLGKVKRRHGKTWVKATRPDGTTGFILGDSHVFLLRRVEVDRPADLYDKVGEDKQVIHQYKKRDRLVMQDVVREGDIGWVKVEDTDGRKGFISGKTRIRVVPDDLEAAGKKNMLIGAVWVVGGLALTILTLTTSAQTGATYIIAWGAVIFGAIQVAQGLMQFFAGRKEKEKSR